MEVQNTFICKCNNRDYITNRNLKQHRKTKVHLDWENRSELRDLKIDLTRKDNIIKALEADKSHLQELNLMLMRNTQRKTVRQREAHIRDGLSSA
tara:strand:- start:85 stop:369 length:285 start_codon:yes stop_codon:yes gene_type:complete